MPLVSRLTTEGSPPHLLQEAKQRGLKHRGHANTPPRAGSVTLDEVDEHLQVSDLGFELFHQLLFDSGWVHDLSDGGVDPLSQLFGRQVANVLIQVHVQLLDQLVDDDLEVRFRVKEANATLSTRPN